MKDYKIRKGDLIVAADQRAIVTKTTQSYIYYILSGHQAKVSKKTLWSAYDEREDVSIHYGNLKYRRLQKKMRTLNLHGTKHKNADEKIRKFLNFVELPCKIITGNSTLMKEFVKIVTSEYGWSCHEESAMNPGTMIITEA